MDNTSQNPENDKKDLTPDEGKGQEKAYEKWKDKDKNNMGNDVTSEVKIANAGGQMEGGDNKQWHMDQGDFDKEEKDFFENSGDSK
jgi:hypothetical protein